jgi:hypothetical protein
MLQIPFVENRPLQKDKLTFIFSVKRTEMTRKKNITRSVAAAIPEQAIVPRHK